MPPNSPKATPTGKRYIVKKPCASCDSKGYSISKSRKTCSECKGIGWLTDKHNDAIICPSCDGFRTVEVETRHKCEKCQGKGQFVHIMQDFAYEKLCKTCKEKGKIKCDACKDKKGNPCNKCHGSGIIPDGSHCPYCDDLPHEPGTRYKHYNIRWWLNQGAFGNDMNDRIRILDLLENADLGQPLTTGSSQFARSRFCKTCSKEVVAHNCPTCDAPTQPRIRQYYDATCAKCKGRSNRVVTCPDCNGSGTCPECHSTGLKTCGNCQGGGRISYIVAKEV